jgi:hypothetical protein
LDRSSRRQILEQIGRHLYGELVPPPAMEESGVEGVVCGVGFILRMRAAGVALAARPPALRREGRHTAHERSRQSSPCRFSRHGRRTC